MIIPQAIKGTTTALNQRFTTTRLNTYRIIFLTPGNGAATPNTGSVRIAHSILATEPATGKQVLNTPPLIDDTNYIAKIEPGGTATFEAAAFHVERGERYDLSQFYFNGEAVSDIVIARYDLIAEL